MSTAEEILRSSELTVSSKYATECSCYGVTVSRKGKKLFYKAFGESITREKALEELSKPYSIRKALNDASLLLKCSGCGSVAVGDDIRSFTYVGYKRQTGVYLATWNPVYSSVPFYLCPSCCEKILSQNL